MSRSRVNEPISDQHRNVDAATGPSLRAGFESLASFVDDITQYSTRVFEDLQALGRRHNRDELERVQHLIHQVESVKADVSDVQRSSFDGLRRLFVEKRPECRHFTILTTPSSNKESQVSSLTISIIFCPI